MNKHMMRIPRQVRYLPGDSPVSYLLTHHCEHGSLVPVSNNSFSILRTNNGWTDNVDNFTVHCDCGVASGMGHADLASALREPLHICPNFRTYPRYSGIVVAGPDTAPRAGECQGTLRGQR